MDGSAERKKRASWNRIHNGKAQNPKKPVVLLKPRHGSRDVCHSLRRQTGSENMLPTKAGLGLLVATGKEKLYPGNRPMPQVRGCRDTAVSPSDGKVAERTPPFRIRITPDASTEMANRYLIQ